MAKSDKRQVKVYDEMEIAEFDYHYNAIEVRNGSLTHARKRDLSAWIQLNCASHVQGQLGYLR